MAGRTHDPAQRRRALRKGRERGCSIYITGEQLERIGFAPDEPAPWYRVWETSDGRPRIIVNLYREA